MTIWRTYLQNQPLELRDKNLLVDCYMTFLTTEYVGKTNVRNLDNQIVDN